MIERLEGSSQTALTSMKKSERLVEETSERITISDSAAFESCKEIDAMQSSISEISTTTEEQTAVIKDINNNVNELTRSTQNSLWQSKLNRIF